MPIKPAGLSSFVSLFKNRFDELLGGKGGPNQWAVAGPLMRDNSRFVGTFAEFFANRKQKAFVDRDELMLAVALVKVQCQALQAAGQVLEGLEYCTEVKLTAGQKAILEAMVTSA